jgi:hypothetical protein
MPASARRAPPRPGLEQEAAQGCGARIADEPRWHDQADSSAGPDELQRPLHEQLIEIHVRTALQAVDSCLPDELGQLVRVASSVIPRVASAAVSADHVPGRIADDGIEPRRPSLVSLCEDVRERQRPVQEAMARGDVTGDAEQPVRCVTGQRRRPIQQTVEEIQERAPVWRSGLLPEPAGAPQVEHLRPLRERRLGRPQILERALLPSYGVGRVVRLQ